MLNMGKIGVYLTPSPSPTRRGESMGFSCGEDFLANDLIHSTMDLTPGLLSAVRGSAWRGEKDLTPGPSPTRRGEMVLYHVFTVSVLKW